MRDAQAQFGDFGQNLAIAGKPIGFTRKMPSYGNYPIRLNICVSGFNGTGNPSLNSLLRKEAWSFQRGAARRHHESTP